MSFGSVLRKFWAGPALQAAFRAGQADNTGAERFSGSNAEFQDSRNVDYFLGNAAVYAAVKLRSDSMGMLGVKLFRVAGSTRDEVGPDDPVMQLLQTPNEGQTLTELLRWMEAYLCIWGEAYLVLEESGQPRVGVDPALPSIWPARPDRMRLIPGEGLGGAYVEGYRYDGASGRPVHYLPEEVERFPWINPTGIRTSASPVQAAKSSMDLIDLGIAHNRETFRGGPPDVVFIGNDEVLDRDVDAFFRRWEERYTGRKGQRRPGFVQNVSSVETLGFSNRDLEFENMLAFSIQEVGRVFGIPAPLLNDLERATLSNVREYERNFWRNTMQPEAYFMQDRFNSFLFPKLGFPEYRMEFSFDRVTVLGDAEEVRVERERDQLDRGVVTINEVRATRGLGDVAWGNEPGWQSPAAVAAAARGPFPEA